MTYALKIAVIDWACRVVVEIIESPCDLDDLGRIDIWVYNERVSSPSTHERARINIPILHINVCVPSIHPL